MTTSLKNVTEMTITTKMMTYLPFPLQGDSLLTRVAKQLGALYSYVLGPAMTDFQRRKRAISDWECQRTYNYF